MIVEFLQLKNKFHDMIPRRLLQFSEDLVQYTMTARGYLAIEGAQARYMISIATWHWVADIFGIVYRTTKGCLLEGL